jgi:hypothetical protein
VFLILVNTGLCCDASVILSGLFYCLFYFDFCLLMQLATLKGHIDEVLHLAISPDGQVASP